MSRDEALKILKAIAAGKLKKVWAKSVLLPSFDFRIIPSDWQSKKTGKIYTVDFKIALGKVQGVQMVSVEDDEWNHPFNKKADYNPWSLLESEEKKKIISLLATTKGGIKYEMTRSVVLKANDEVLGIFDNEDQAIQFLKKKR